MKKFLLPLVFLVLSCSTTRVLQQDQYRFTGNKIEIAGEYGIKSSELEPYIRQNSGAFGWNPFMCVYNWQNGKGKAWDQFVSRVGVAPAVFDELSVPKSEENIRSHLEYLGFFGSKVSSAVVSRGRKVSVIYDIIPGRQIPIKEIHFSVPGGEFEESFYADTASMLIRKGLPLSEALLEQETQRATTVLRNQGFYTFNKNYYFFEADTLDRKDSAILYVSVREYTRNENPSESKPIRKFSYDKVSISYPRGLDFKESVLKNLNTIKPGNLYSEKDVNNTYSRISALQVFSGVNVRMDQKAEDKVDCSINLSQSKVQGYKLNLEASSNSTGLFGVSPQVSYFNKNIFKGGEWLNLSFMGNFQFKLNDDTHSNEFGISAGLSFPRPVFFSYDRFKGRIPRTDVNVSYNYQSRPEYTRNILSTSAGINGSYAGKLFYQLMPLQLSIVHLQNLDKSFYSTLQNDPFLRNAYQDHFDLGSGAMLYYTTDSDAIPKTSVFYSRLQLDVAGNLLSTVKGLMKKDDNGSGIIWGTPFSQYVRTELTLGKTWRIGKNDNHSIATRVLAGAGWAYGNSSVLPFEKHFYAGGANSLRGWQARSVGPGTSSMDSSFSIPNQTGDMKLEANLEWRFYLLWKLEGALFYDMGNVWTLRDSSESGSFSLNRLDESIAANWGTGLRVNLNFLLLRVDLGVKLHDPSRNGSKWVTPSDWFANKGFALHFGVGYPF